MGNKTKRILAAQHKRITGNSRPIWSGVFYGTIADLYRSAIRKLGEEPHA